MAVSTPDAELEMTIVGFRNCMRRGGQPARRAGGMLASACLGLAVFLAACIGGAGAARAFDWVVNNEGPLLPVPAGATISHSITVSNAGANAAPATRITLDITGPGTFTGASGTIVNCSPAPNAAAPVVITCDVPPLAGNAEATLTANVLATAPGLVSLTARVPDDDGSPGNNADAWLTTVNAGADIELSAAGPATAQTGSIATYTFTATNLGPSAASGLTLTIPVPSGLLVPVPDGVITPNPGLPAGCALSGGDLVCSIAGPIAKGGAVSIPLVGQIATPSASTVSLTGTIGGGTPADPISGNNTVTTSTNVQAGSDVKITKAVSPAGAFAIGEEATFTLTAAFTGDTPTNLVITDTIPANYRVLGITPSAGSGWSCAQSGQTITCNRASGGPPGAQRPLGSITVVTEVVSTGSATNIATITSDGPTDPVPGNNEASDGGVLIQNPVADLRANKSGPNPALVVPGQAFNFSISTSNIPKSNPRSAPFTGKILMTDTIPAGLEVTGVTLNGWSCTPAPPVAGQVDIVCERSYTEAAPLAVNATTPAVVFATRATTTGTLVNRMEVTTEGANWPDNNLANNVVSVGVGAQRPEDSADVRVIKTRALAAVAAGEVQTFAVEIINDGPNAATSVSVSDDLTGLINNSAGATGAGFIDATVASNAASPFTCNSAAISGSTTSRRLTCSIATLPVCTAGSDCPVITVQVRPGGSVLNKSNTASAVSNLVADPNRANNSGSVTYTLLPRADVTVEKAASTITPSAGQNVTYTVTARTVVDGRNAAEGVTVTDTLPDGMTFVSAVPAAGSCSTTPVPNTTTGPGNNQVVCSLGTLEQGAQQTVTIVARPNSATRGTTLTNRVSVSTTTPGDDPANNEASLSVAVANPDLDLLVTKTDLPDPTSVGLTTDYTITVTNIGPSAAENVVVEDTLPSAGLLYLSHAIPADGSCSIVPVARSLAGTLRCAFPMLADGQSRTITVTMQGAEPGVFTNQVSVTSAEVLAGFDRIPGNNAASQATTVRSRADVEVVSKTASLSAVNLGTDFSYEIIVRNRTGTDPLTGAILGVADGVVLADDLPAGMILAGQPSARVTSGTTTLNSCPGASGATSFTCSFGTLSSGAEIAVTVPVRVTVATSSPQTFDNTATVETASVDIDPGNNAKSETVTVTASGLSGTVFRDFANNGVLDGGDTGVAGVTITLAGTASDGAPVSRTAVTGADGRYAFTLLPPGTYSLTRGAVSEPNLNPGQSLPGSAGGATSGATAITAIAMPAGASATGYDFTLVPLAAIGLVKTVTSAPAPSADGSFSVSFGFEVRNPSREALDDIVVTDRLEGAAPLFGTYAASPSAPGQYTVSGAPAGTCGGLNGGFDGASNQALAQGFSLASGESCTIAITLRVIPAAPPPADYENRADVNGTGSLSGQAVSAASTAAIAPPSFTASITLEKSEGVFTDNQPSGLNPGDTLAYTFTVTNTGTLTLRSVAVTDAKVTNIACPVTTLAPGASATCAGDAYVLTRADISAGQVVNTATASGTPPAGPPVQDEDTSTTRLPELAQLAIEKVMSRHTDADGNGFVSPGDTLTYTVTATNTGNTTLTNVVVSDSRITPDATSCTALAPSQTCVLTGSLAVTIDDAQAGEIVNTATADSTETPPVADSVTVPVRAGGDGGSLTKTALVTTVKRGERVPYVITATDVPFAPARIVDLMPPGFAYVPGSAVANGEAVEPAVSGRSLTFDDLMPDADDAITLELTLVATSSAATGDNVNQAQLIDPDTGEVAATARARVTILEEAVFDCSDVIGKVFDDANRNGYQDEGERGLPAVRLATVKGLLVTTDAHGRFSIACADIPDAGIGANFLVKLDPRTLPTGYRVTTENPRKVRLTRGKVVKLNFGAALTRLVSLDLNAKVFEQGSGVLKAKWQAGLGRVIAALQKEPSTLRITYVGEGGQLAKARLRAVTREIERRWQQEGGGYRLPIETRIVAPGEEGRQ